MKILTWNIQAGIATEKYSHYLTRAHRQIMDTPGKRASLEAVADVAAEYDIVCLQEVDLGGRRSGFLNQAEVIAGLSGHDHVCVQENRAVRNVSRHGNAILSRDELTVRKDLKLPGKISGRGALIAEVRAGRGLTVANTHLSLGRADQRLQLSAIEAALPRHGRWVLCGDLNLASASPIVAERAHGVLANMAARGPASYPAWKPQRDIDHIIPGPGAQMSAYRALSARASDHLPVCADIAFEG